MSACIQHNQQQPTLKTGVYKRRRPEKTAAYQAVQHHLETWLETTREANPDYEAIPHYIERDLRRFLECGILAYGFARVYCDHCGRDYLLAYSCKGRGICPSCNTKRMVETAAHLVDQLFPLVTVRQWVITLPKRLRYYLHQNNELSGSVLRIGLRVIQQLLRDHCPEAPPSAKYGGVTYIHRFGASLNAHIHYHSCIVDGLFAETEKGMRFYQTADLSDEVIHQAQEQIRKRILRLFVRRELLTPEAADQMKRWKNGGGFTLHGEVQIEATNRTGLERLLRYCARPIFAGERLSWKEEDEHLIYQLPKPSHDGQTQLRLTPTEFLDRIAALIPQPRKHRHRYHGVLAPNAPLRKKVTARAGQPVNAVVEADPVETKPVELDESSVGALTASIWAMLITRIYEINPLICPMCGNEMRIIALTYRDVLMPCEAGCR